MFAQLILIVLLHSSTALIRTLNDSDYARMPPVFHLDNYEECFNKPEAMYCAAEFAVVSDEPSQLLTMMHEYSKLPTHYNHTLLRHGYCMHKTCKKFYNVSEVDLRLALEACVNESLYIKYKLKAIVTDNIDCAKRDREQPIDNLDISVAVICIIIVMVNLIASLCDHYLDKKLDHGGLKFLYCFSIFRNWKKFTASPKEFRDSRLSTLQGIHGFRVITTFAVVVGHTFLIGSVYISNPDEVENTYDITFYNVFRSGTLAMQTFFVISSFLLAYNWLLYSEKRVLSWKMLPQQILMRWLRLTPSYALVLGLTATWFSRLSSGPNWKGIIYSEMSDCRHDWWKHLLYINNYYFEGSTCMPHTWYLAADTQLYCVGVIVFLICRTGLTRKVVLSLLFVVGMILPSLHIYYQNLNGVLVQSPEIILALYTKDPTFNLVYIRGHTNLTGCIIGLAVGYIIYDWQKGGGDPKKFRKYRYLYWSLFFWVMVCFSCGVIYYYGDQQPPIYVNVLFGALLKPVFGLLVAGLLIGVIIQFEGLYRPVMEWQPLVYVSKLSYSVYLVHVVFIKAEIASMNTLQIITEAAFIQKCAIVIAIAYISAFLFYMLVETPSGNLVQVAFGKSKKQIKEDNIEEAVEEEEFNKTEDDKGTDFNQTRIEDGATVNNVKQNII